jgi:hypothetical protein
MYSRLQEAAQVAVSWIDNSRTQVNRAEQDAQLASKIGKLHSATVSATEALQKFSEASANGALSPEKAKNLGDAFFSAISSAALVDKAFSPADRAAIKENQDTRLVVSELHNALRDIVTQAKKIIPANFAYATRSAHFEDLRRKYLLEIDEAFERAGGESAPDTTQETFIQSAEAVVATFDPVGANTQALRDAAHKAWERDCAEAVTNFGRSARAHEEFVLDLTERVEADLFSFQKKLAESESGIDREFARIESELASARREYKERKTVTLISAADYYAQQAVVEAAKPGPVLVEPEGETEVISDASKVLNNPSAVVEARGTTPTSPPEPAQILTQLPTPLSLLGSQREIAAPAPAPILQLVGEGTLVTADPAARVVSRRFGFTGARSWIAAGVGVAAACFFAFLATHSKQSNAETFAKVPDAGSLVTPSPNAERPELAQTEPQKDLPPVVATTEPIRSDSISTETAVTSNAPTGMAENSYALDGPGQSTDESVFFDNLVPSPLLAEGSDAAPAIITPGDRRLEITPPQQPELSAASTPVETKTDSPISIAASTEPAGRESFEFASPLALSAQEAEPALQFGTPLKLNDASTLASATTRPVPQPLGDTPYGTPFVLGTDSESIDFSGAPSAPKLEFAFDDFSSPLTLPEISGPVENVSTSQPAPVPQTAVTHAQPKTPQQYFVENPIIDSLRWPSSSTDTWSLLNAQKERNPIIYGLRQFARRGPGPVETESSSIDLSPTPASTTRAEFGSGDVTYVEGYETPFRLLPQTVKEQAVAETNAGFTSPFVLRDEVQLKSPPAQVAAGDSFDWDLDRMGTPLVLAESSFAARITDAEALEAENQGMSPLILNSWRFADEKSAEPKTLRVATTADALLFIPGAASAPGTENKP